MSANFKYSCLDNRNAAVLLVDHQSGLCNIVGDFKAVRGMLLGTAHSSFPDSMAMGKVRIGEKLHNQVKLNTSETNSCD